MADHTPSTTARPADAGLVGLIEKGATVHDAAGIALGNVTDVDLARQRLVIDGRPVDHGLFEVPLSAVASVQDNEVHLSIAMNAQSATPGSVPSFMAPPEPIEPARSPLTEPTATADYREPVAQATFGSPIGTTVGATSAFVRPTVQTPPPGQPLTAGPPPTWARSYDDGEHDDRLFRPTVMGMAGLGAAGLAVAGYAWWRRRQRKSALERAIDFATDYTTRVHPAWWAGLASAALGIPLAYSLLPDETVSTDQARAWLNSVGQSSRGLGDDQLATLRRFTRQAADQPLPSLGRQAGRWGHGRSGQWDRLVEALADRLPSVDSLPSFESLPSRSDLTSFGDGKTSRLATYGLSAVGIALAGALIYTLTRKAGQARSSTRVADVMTQRPQVIRPDASVAEAAALMRNLDIGAVPICDGSRLVGMLTDRDIAVRLAAEGRDPQRTQVRDVMSHGVTWASEDDPVEEAARIMREHQIRRLPIVDERHNLVGIVSLGDLATETGDDRLSGATLEEISQPS